MSRCPFYVVRPMSICLQGLCHNPAVATSAGRSLFTGNVKRGCGLGEAVFVLGDAAVESRVGRLGISNCQPRASAAVRRCVDARVVPYINPVPLPSTYTHSTPAPGWDTPSRTVLDFEDDSRTKTRGLGLGLEEVLPWPWPSGLDSIPVTHM